MLHQLPRFLAISLVSISSFLLALVLSNTPAAAETIAPKALSELNSYPVSLPVANRTEVGDSVIIDQPVEGDLVVLANNILVNSEVKGDALIIGVNVLIVGDIKGDLRIVSSNAELYGSKIGGDLQALAGNLSRREDLLVEGKQSVHTLSSINLRGRLGDLDRVNSIAAIFALALLTGQIIVSYLFFRLIGKNADKVLTKIVNKPLVNMLVGVVSCIALLVVGFLSLATVIGIPAVGIIAAGGYLLLVVSMQFAAYGLGYLLLGHLQLGWGRRLLPLIFGYSALVILLVLGLVFQGVVLLAVIAVILALHFWAAGAIVRQILSKDEKEN